MLPQVRYVRSQDGTSIAYSTLGTGEPLVLAPNIPICHLQLEWEVPQLRSAYEALATGRMLVMFDARGLGLSQRQVAERGLDAHVADLEAVTQQLGLRNFALFGLFHAGPIVIRFAARHPESVSRLALWATYADLSEYARSSRVEASRALMYKDWEAFAQTLAFYASGWEHHELGRALARLIREAASQDEVTSVLAATADFNVTEDLEQVRCPTLVMHRRKVDWPDADVTRRLAGAIKGARLVGFDGEGVLPWSCEVEQIIATLREFLGEGTQAAEQPAALAAPALKELTEREIDVLRLLASGSSNKEIAASLTLSVHTIERHLANIYAKINARGRSDATAFALRNGLS